ncbi:MAG: hypothetical protein IPO47_15210 [Bacteroidetes bacterium]|nr:hypothetical protein [Bacteroidota bacterium]
MDRVLFPDSTVEISYAIDVPIGSHSVKVICQNPNEINQYDKDPTNDSQMYQLIQNTIEGCEDFSGDYLSDGWTLFQSYPYVDFMTTSYPCSPDVLQTYVPTCLFGFYDSTAINTLETTYNFSDATNYADIILSFDRANKNDNNVSKTTKLFVTGTNCNSGIDTLLYLEGATLASTPGNIPICNSWNPVFCSDWDTSNLSLCQYMGSIVTIEFEILSQYYSGNVYLDNICIDFIEKPNSEELIESCDDTVFLSANVISNGYWSIIYGFGGHIFNASNPNSKFSGVHGNTYIITWNYLNGCGILYSDTTTINLLGTLNPIVEYDESLCIGDTLSLFTMDDPSLNFNWSGPNGFISNINNPSISNVSELNSGVYSLFTFNDNGCISDTINVEINVFQFLDYPK